MVPETLLWKGMCQIFYKTWNIHKIFVQPSHVLWDKTWCDAISWQHFQRLGIRALSESFKYLLLHFRDLGNVSWLLVVFDWQAHSGPRLFSSPHTYHFIINGKSLHQSFRRFSVTVRLQCVTKSWYSALQQPFVSLQLVLLVFKFSNSFRTCILNTSSCQAGRLKSALGAFQNARIKNNTKLWECGSTVRTKNLAEAWFMTLMSWDHTISKKAFDNNPIFLISYPRLDSTS